MKRKLISFVGASAFILTIGAMATEVMAQTKLISSHSTSGRGPFGTGLKWFNAEVEKRSGQKIKFETQWGGALFKAPAARKSIADGIADMGTVIGAYTPREMVAYTIADLPVLEADAWVSMRATHELMTTEPSVSKHFAAQNLVYIGSYTTSAVQIICKGKPVRTIKDIKGRKIRGIGVYGKVFKELGANLVSMSYYKAYQALDTGLLHCTQGYAYATASLKHYEVSDNITLLNWGQIGALGLFMNKDAFDRLSPKEQQVLREVGDDIADYYGEVMTTANDKALEAMKAGIKGKKLAVYNFEEADRAVLKKRGEKYTADWVKNASKSGLDGIALLARMKALVAKYKKQRDEKGYPWAK